MKMKETKYSLNFEGKRERQLIFRNFGLVFGMNVLHQYLFISYVFILYVMSLAHGRTSKIVREVLPFTTILHIQLFSAVAHS